MSEQTHNKDKRIFFEAARRAGERIRKEEQEDPEGCRRRRLAIQFLAAELNDRVIRGQAIALRKLRHKRFRG